MFVNEESTQAPQRLRVTKLRLSEGAELYEETWESPPGEQQFFDTTRERCP